MLLRALFAFVALPGVVAYAVPALWLARTHARLAHPSGLVVAFAGTSGLLWCAHDFYVRGRGTLAPWSPPRELVVTGLYRHSRNPMYVCVLLVLVGWGLAFAHLGIAIYGAFVALAFHLRVVFGEEPWLAHTHGARWVDYAAHVRRWI